MIPGDKFVKSFAKFRKVGLNFKFCEKFCQVDLNCKVSEKLDCFVMNADANILEPCLKWEII